MAREEINGAASAPDSGDRAASFLVRVWKEPGATEEGPHLRGYFRNLRTGEERYLADGKALMELLWVEPEEGAES